MNPTELVKTIYLGDRACNAIVLEGTERRVSVRVDEISRLRPGSSSWDYYNEMNIVNGAIVFTDVTSIQFAPAGPLPNDLINEITVVARSSDDGSLAYEFRIAIDSAEAHTNATEVNITIAAGGMHLEDPSRPGVRITDY